MFHPAEPQPTPGVQTPGLSKWLCPAQAVAMGRGISSPAPHEIKARSCCLHRPNPQQRQLWLPKRFWWHQGGCKSHFAGQAESAGGEIPVLYHTRAMQREFCPNLISLLLSQSLILNRRTHIPSGYLRITTEIHPLGQPGGSAEQQAPVKPQFLLCSPGLWGTDMTQGGNFPAATSISPEDLNAIASSPKGQAPKPSCHFSNTHRHSALCLRYKSRISVCFLN